MDDCCANALDTKGGTNAQGKLQEKHTFVVQIFSCGNASATNL